MARRLPNRDVDRDWCDDARAVAKTYRDPCCWCCPPADPVSGWDKLVVHHQNADRDDNHPRNLLPVCRPCHGKIHGGSGTANHQYLWRKLPEASRTGVATESVDREVAIDQHHTYDLLREVVNRKRDQNGRATLKPWEFEQRLCSLLLDAIGTQSSPTAATIITYLVQS